jgi:hypothetical protein
MGGYGVGYTSYVVGDYWGAMAPLAALVPLITGNGIELLIDCRGS